MKDDLLKNLREKARERPDFVAYAFALYQQANEWSDEQLAQWLGCTADQLGRLGLCHRPLGSDWNFRQQVEQLASFAGADALKLVQMLRTCEGISAFRDAPPIAPGAQPVRLAARQAKKSVDKTPGSSLGREP